MTNPSLDFDRFPRVDNKVGTMRRTVTTDTGGSRWPTGLRFTTGFIIVLSIGLLSWPYLPRRYDASAALILRPTNEFGQIDPALSLRQALDDGAVQSEVDAMTSTTMIGNVITTLKLVDDPEFKSGRSLLQTRLIDPVMRLAGVEAQASDITAYGDIIRQVQDRLTVSRDRRSYTIRVSFSAADPAKAARMANGLMDAYLDHQRERKRASIAVISTDLKRQLVELTTRHNEVQRELQVMAKAPESGLSADSSSITRLIDALAVERGRLTARKAEIAATIPGGGSPPAPSTAAAALTDQKPTDQNAATRALLAEDGRLTTQQQSIDTEIDRLTLEARQRASVETQIASLRAEYASLSSQIGTLKARLIARENAGEEAAPDVEIIAKATVPLKAAFPNPLLTGLAIILGGLLAGGAMIWPSLVSFFRRGLSARNPD